MASLLSVLLIASLLVLGNPLVVGEGIFDVTCRSLGDRMVRSLRGVRYCCNFTNPSRDLPINNYRFTTRNFAPLALDTGTQTEITPGGTVDAYVGPRHSKTFCFVNDVAAGTPVFLAFDNPYPLVSISTHPSPWVAFNCTASPPTFPRFDLHWGNGRDVLVMFHCTLRSLVGSFLSSVAFNCYGIGPMDIILTNTFNPDCTYQGYLHPAGTRGSSDSFSFSILAPVSWEHLYIDISVANVAPPPQSRCIVPYNVIPTPSANLSTVYSNTQSCVASLALFCQNPPQPSPRYPANVVIFRLAVNTTGDRRLKASTIPISGGHGYDTVMYLLSRAGPETTYLQCNDDVSGGYGGSVLFFTQRRNTQYDILITGYNTLTVGTFPFVLIVIQG